MHRNFKHIILSFSALVCALAAHAQINTDQVLRIGQNALYFEDYMLSIQYFNQAIEAKPYLAQPYFYRAVAKLNLDDYAGAEADASRAVEMNPFLADAWEVRGVARHNLGMPRKAAEDYAEALKLLPRNRQILFNRAQALGDIKEYDQALDIYAELLKYYPGFDNAYLGRARTKLALKDTVAAKADIDKALQINDKAVNAYILRADIALNTAGGDRKEAMADLDRAIKLQPNAAGLYINRAFLRYQDDSFYGAMEDYDQALALEPLNTVALFNRSLLRMEVAAYDNALEDLNQVIKLDPEEYRAIFNRAIIYKNKRNYNAAIADLNRVAKAFPDFPDPIYMRGELHRLKGDLYKAEADFKKARAMAKAITPEKSKKYAHITATAPNADIAGGAEDESVPDENRGAVSRRFASLLTVAADPQFAQEYNNSAIRGRVQNKNVAIEPEDMVLLTFYISPGELKKDNFYMKEVDELNATRALRNVLMMSTAVPQMDDETAQKHFKSIEYYNTYLATHRPRPVDLIGRAMDYITVRDYASAVRDASRAAEMAPELPLPYMIRAQARYGMWQLGKDAAEPEKDAKVREAMQRKALAEVAEDYRMAIARSPRSAVAYYNLANIEYLQGNDAAATEAYTRAIELKPDFGQAYFNRAYLALREGRKNDGIADLGKAGELGIVAAYNLIKRISQ